MGLDGLLNSTYDIFFPAKFGGDIMSEVACEPNQMCDRNQSCFKAFLSTWLGFVTTIAPHTAKNIFPKLKASAVGAAQQCSGPDDNQHCGRRWYQAEWDGTKGMEEQMSALGIFSATIVTHEKHSQGPLSHNTGGNSESNPSAGLSPASQSTQLPAISTGDRAGAGILTVLFLSGWTTAMGFTLWGT